MIYDRADIVARRLLGQKVPEVVCYETAQTSEDIRRLLVKTARVVVSAPRQSGKTTELLRFAEDHHLNSQYCVVSMSYEVQRGIIARHRELFIAKNIADRMLTGKPVESVDVNPPLMLTPDALHLNKGRNLPMFVDEFYALAEDIQKAILDSGLFVAAVTS